MFNKIYHVQWTLANPNSLGPEPIQISEIFGLVKATAATWSDTVLFLAETSFSYCSISSMVQ